MQPNSNGYTPWGEFADLDSYGSDAKPQYVITPGLDTIAAGDYDCLIVHAILDKTQGGHRVVRTELQIAGRTIEYLWWLNRQQGVNAFLADMLTLGFPAGTWGSQPGRTPLSVAIPDAVKRLGGIRFRATKASRPDKDTPAKIYHDLHIGGRITAAPMPGTPQVAQTAPAVSFAQPAAQAPALVTAGAAEDDDSIPF